MPLQIGCKTHSWSEDTERGIGTEWLPGRLSPGGRELATELGERRRAAGVAVFAADPRRTAEHDRPRRAQAGYGRDSESRKSLAEEAQR